MDTNKDKHIAAQIQAIFGVTPEERNTILFDCGGRLALRLRMLGVPIVEDHIFWDEFGRLFRDDDVRILQDLESRRHDYVKMKEAVVIDFVFERQLLEGLKRATTAFDCLNKATCAVMAAAAEVAVAAERLPADASASRTVKKKKAPTDTSDVWRKRLIAAIGGYLSLKDERADIDRIKAVACRAAGKDDFNRIGMAQLRSLYNAFVKQQKDLRNVQALIKQQTENH